MKMPPEIITTKRDTEIGRLLERVIRDHRKDISTFSRGHLNENNLYKPPEAGRKSWETAKLPAIKLKNAVKIDKTEDRKMWDAVACFSAGSALVSPAARDPPLLEDIDIEPGDRVHLEEFDASYILLPQKGGYKVVPSLHGGLRKREDCSQNASFDTEVVEKHNLTDKGWYNGTRAVKDIKKMKIGSTLQGFKKLWRDISEKSNTYNPLMGEIRQYYDGYLEYLKNSDVVSFEEETASEEIETKKDAITNLTGAVQELESKALDVMKRNELLKEEFELTETVLSEIKLQTDIMQDSAISSKTDLKSVIEPSQIATNIETLRKEILHKQDEIDNIRRDQRKIMVPMEVYQCMVQCVQSAEIENQKQLKSAESLEKKRSRSEGLVLKEMDKLGLTVDQKDQLLKLLGN